MVKVQIIRNSNGSVLTFYASGHADESDWIEESSQACSDFDTLHEDEIAANSEYNLVCAAISAIMQTALLGLGNYVDLKDRLTYNIDADGWLYCQLPGDLSPAERVKADAIIETMIIGLQSIETDYPDKIMVEEEVE